MIKSELLQVEARGLCAREGVLGVVDKYQAMIRPLKEQFIIEHSLPKSKKEAEKLLEEGRDRAKGSVTNNTIIHCEFYYDWLRFIEGKNPACPWYPI